MIGKSFIVARPIITSRTYPRQVGGKTSLAAIGAFLEEMVGTLIGRAAS